MNDLNDVFSGTELSTTFANESVEDLLYEFLRDRTPMTERAYRRDLKHFFSFSAKEFGVPTIEKGVLKFEQVKRVHIVKYKKYLETSNCLRRKPYAPHSVNRKLSAVSSFYQFLVRREVVLKNPVEFCIRPKRVVEEETQALSDREMKLLFDLVIEKASALHKAVILTLFTTGMRQAELRNLRMNNYHQNEGIRFLTYIGKGQKRNQVPLHPTTVYYVDQYIKFMESGGRIINKNG